MQTKIKFKDTAMCVVSGSGDEPRRRSCLRLVTCLCNTTVWTQDESHIFTVVL